MNKMMNKIDNKFLGDSIIYVKGRLNIKEGENAKIIANEFKDINDNIDFGENKKYTAKKTSKTGLYLKIDSFSNNDLLDRIKYILLDNRGTEYVYLYADDTKQLYKWNGISININENVIHRLESLLPKANIKVKM